MPAEIEPIIQSCMLDLTSRSLRRQSRRGVPVTPADTEWIIECCVPDSVGGSLCGVGGDDCVKVGIDIYKHDAHGVVELRRLIQSLAPTNGGAI